jgi:integrase
MLKEDNVRKGFLKIEDYLTLAAHCSLIGKWLRGLFEIGHCFGFRSDEVIELRVARLDMVNRAVRLDETKNDDTRWAYMTENLYQALLPLVEGKGPQGYVFTRNDGSRVIDFRKAWWEACSASGLGTMHCRACKASSNSSSWCDQCHSDNIGYIGLLYHDLRRTAIRNMRRRGVQEGAAMAISGHKTRDVFLRYYIVDEVDLQQARDRMQKGEEEEMARLEEYEADLELSKKDNAQITHDCTKSGHNPPASEFR